MIESLQPITGARLRLFSAIVLSVVSVSQNQNVAKYLTVADNQVQS